MVQEKKHCLPLPYFGPAGCVDLLGVLRHRPIPRAIDVGPGDVAARLKRWLGRGIGVASANMRPKNEEKRVSGTKHARGACLVVKP